VRDPGIADSVQESRVGLWYYGAGQALAAIPVFRSIEGPYLQLHEAVHTCLKLVMEGVLDDSLDRAMGEMDVRTDRLIVQLHALERELVRDMAMESVQGPP
jgi:hypothetical protein